jgi:hypothetical protein
MSVWLGAIVALVLNDAGWHTTPRLRLSDNIVLLPLPPYAPGLNPMENVLEFLRGNILRHRVWHAYEAILDRLPELLEHPHANVRPHHLYDQARLAKQHTG